MLFHRGDGHDLIHLKKEGGGSQEPRQKPHQVLFALGMKEVYAALDDGSLKVLGALADVNVSSCKMCICI